MKHHVKLSVCLWYSLISPCSSMADDKAIFPPNPFKQTLAYVYMHDPQLQSQREELRILDERVSQAKAGFRPNLNASIEQGRQRVKIENQPWQNGADRNTGIVATQPIFNGFGTQAERDAARERVVAGRAALLSTEQEVLFSAITAWLEVCEKTSIASLSQDNAAAMNKYLNATQERYKGGDSTTTDISLAQSRLAEAQALAALADADKQVAIATFERDTGMQPIDIAFPPSPEPLPASLEDASNSASANPDLLQAQHAQAASGHDIKKAVSVLWPSVYLRGSINQERSSVLGLGTLRDDAITFNVSIPLYQGGAEYSRIREAKIAREKSRLNTLDVTRDVIQRARMSYNNYMASVKIIKASGQSADAAGQALSGITEEQAQGTRTLTEVLDAQSSLLTAQITQIRANKNMRLEAYRLLAAIGQLTAAKMQLPVNLYDPDPYSKESEDRWAGTSITNEERPTASNAQ